VEDIAEAADTAAAVDTAAGAVDIAAAVDTAAAAADTAAVVVVMAVVAAAVDMVAAAISHLLLYHINMKLCIFFVVSFNTTVLNCCRQLSHFLHFFFYIFS
jgi:hypothetical protein